MNREEIEKRIEYFIRHEALEAKPYCSQCDEDANLYDPYDAQNFCEPCLVLSLSKDLVFLKENTEYTGDSDVE